MDEAANKGSADGTRDILLASISDLQGSIHALDSKSSAALVVHGLLAAAIGTGAGRNLDAIWQHAVREDAEPLLLSLAGLAVACFLLSVFAFLHVLRPRGGGQAELEHPRVFHPLPLPRNTPSSERNAALEAYLELLQDVDITRDLAAEVLKLRDLLRYQAQWAASGVRFLMLEVGLVVALGVGIALVALGAPACPTGYIAVAGTAVLALVAGRARDPLGAGRRSPSASDPFPAPEAGPERTEPELEETP